MINNESTADLQTENASRRQASRKPPITKSFNQSRRAVKEKSRPISDDKSDGIPDGVDVAVLFEVIDMFGGLSMLMLGKPRIRCAIESILRLL